MKNVLLHIITFVLFASTTTLAQVSEASNQYYAQLRVLESDNDSIKLVLEVALIPSNFGNKLGSSHFCFAYNNQNLSSPLLESNSLTANYDDVRLERLDSNRMMVITSLQNPSTGIQLDTFPKFTSIATMHFDVDVVGNNVFDWTEKIEDTRGTTLYFDDESTLRHPVELLNSTDAIDQVDDADDLFLPIELMSFEAEKMGRNVLLTWLTANENNNDYFEVQRLNKNNEFETIGTVASKGSSDNIQEYEWIDESPLTGVNYYRLHQVDLDETASYSDVLAIEITKPMDMTIFPNPAKDHLSVQTSSHGQEPLTIMIYDQLGRSLKELKNVTEVTFQLDLTDFENGTYMLTVIGADWQTTQKFVVYR